MNDHLLRAYIAEVLTGFRALSSIGPDRALGNLRYGDYTLSQKNRGVLDDSEDEEQKRKQEEDRLNDI